VRQWPEGRTFCSEITGEAPLKRQGKKNDPGKKAAAVGREWVGGRLAAPFYVTEGEPFRPQMILWMELPDGFVLQARLIDPREPEVSFAQTLRQTMESPMAGPPRRPHRVRVADPLLAAELRRAFPGIDIVRAPTPELDMLLRQMAESFPVGNAEPASYLEGGRIPPERVEALFQAGEILHRAAPWKTASDTQVLRLDIPGLQVEGACVSIIGALGQSVGLLLFPSFVAFRSFLKAADPAAGPEKAIDMGTTVLSLLFERGADLPAAMRREVSRYRWRVAGPDAYPRVHHRDRDGKLRPLTERDLRVVTACAGSLAAFFVRNRRVFEPGKFEPVCESHFDRDDLEVRLTVPYEAGLVFPGNGPAPQPPGEPDRPKAGRNAPCPCGSGRKYKKCCLGKDEAAAAARREPASLHETDRRMVEEILRFAARRFGGIIERAGRDFRDPEGAMPLLVPWSVYHLPFEGKPLVRWFLEERGASLSGTEREWLDAQQASWLSVWEVTGVAPGESVSVVDLLSAEQRTVQEIMGSRSLAKRDAVLGRVVDRGEISVFCGLHPRPLPPVEADEAVRRIRGRLRRKSAVPVDRLRDDKLGRHMIAVWQEAVDALDDRRSLPPALHNTDGDELLLTVDHFDFEPASRCEIESGISSIEGTQPPEPGEADPAYAVLRRNDPPRRGMENTVVGRVMVSDGKLRAETNSVKRADALRAGIERACGERVRHRMREHSDPLAAYQQGRPAPPARETRSGLPPGEAARLLREFKQRCYADWPDTALPALGGKTPREASRTRSDRHRVELLIKDMENHEARLPENERFDFDVLRKALGLGGQG